MKNVYKLFMTIGVVLIVSLAMVACDPPLEEDPEIVITVTKSVSQPNREYMGSDAFIGDMLTVVCTDSSVNLEDYQVEWKIVGAAMTESKNQLKFTPAQAEKSYQCIATKDEQKLESNIVYVAKIPEYVDFLGVWYMNKNNQGASGTLPGNTKYSSTADKPFWNEKFVVYYNKIVQDDDDIEVNPAFTFNIDTWGKLGASNIIQADKTAGYNAGFYLKGGIDLANSHNDFYTGGGSYTGYLQPFMDLYLHDNKNYLRRSTNYNVASGNPLNAEATDSITYTFERTKSGW